MKYKLSLIKHWYPWIKRDINRFIYSKIYKFNMNGYNGTLLPDTGKGKYVSVYTKGKIIQIKHESGYEHLLFDEIRIIPFQPNHGVMIERLKNGVMLDRTHISFEDFINNYTNKETQ